MRRQSRHARPPQFVPLDSTLTGYWKFDDATNQTTATDSKGTKNGTLSSTALWTTSGNSYDGIVLTGGTSGSVSIPTFSTTADFTFSAWVKPNAITAEFLYRYRPARATRPSRCTSTVPSNSSPPPPTAQA